MQIRVSAATASLFALLVGAPLAQAATPAQTYAAREAGLDWLVSHQQADGSWLGQGGVFPTGDGVFNTIDTTAVALMSLTSETQGDALVPQAPQGPLGFVGHPSDFQLTAVQQAAVSKGVSYLLSQAQVVPVQAGQGPFGTFNPDVNGNGVGVGWANGSVQSTNLAVLALDQAQRAQYISGYSTLSGGPADIVPTGPLAGRTFGSVSQDVVDFLAYSQADNGPYRGGWDYTANTGGANATQTTYAIMALRALENDQAVTIPAFVRAELPRYASYTTNSAPGPDYAGVGEFGPYSTSFLATLLGTQVPLFEAYLAGPNAYGPVGPLSGAQEYYGALAYLNAHWNDLATGSNALGDGNIGDPAAVWLFDKIFAGVADLLTEPGPPWTYLYDGRKGSLLFGNGLTFPVSDYVTNVGSCGDAPALLASGVCNWSEAYQQWLVTHQNADGSFTSGNGYPNDVATTALYLQAIDGYASPPGGGGVPEPATWALMLLGFGGVGAALRRKAPPLAMDCPCAR